MRPPIDRRRALVRAAAVSLCAAACSAPAKNPQPLAEAPSASPAATAEADEEDDEPVRDGKYLYTRNCAGCHNDNGDGLGPTIVQMGMKARSFAEGHFAFGNTRESIFRTIASGVPGRSPMPGFAMVLSEDERWLVVDYVRTLMPKEEEVDESLSVMHVKDEPVIVRGMLRPIVEGAPEWPRGLVVGLPSGFTFVYRADDVRLLAVYQGEFVDRRDWYDRGGSKLKLLGHPVFVANEPETARPVAVGYGKEGETQFEASNARLISTSVAGGNATVAYVIATRDGGTIEVQETPRVATLAGSPAFVRELTVRGDRAIRFPIGVVSPNAPSEFTDTFGGVSAGARHVCAVSQRLDEQLAWSVAAGHKVKLEQSDGGWTCAVWPTDGVARVRVITWMSPTSFTIEQFESVSKEVLQ